MPFKVAIDYDSTLFHGSYPELGAPKEDVIAKAKELKKYGAELILWTCREGRALIEAKKRAKEVGLEFDAINANSPSQVAYMKKQWDQSKNEIFAVRKIFADVYVDDRAPGSIDFFLKIDAQATCENFEERYD